jgi:hypothetical protein
VGSFSLAKVDHNKEEPSAIGTTKGPNAARKKSEMITFEIKTFENSAAEPVIKTKKTSCLEAIRLLKFIYGVRFQTATIPVLAVRKQGNKGKYYFRPQND